MVLIAFGRPASGQNIRLKIGNIELFGVGGVDTGRIRASLPSLEGREISVAEVGELKAAIKQAITKTTGHPPTDVAFMCCDARGMTTIYIGLKTTARDTLHYKPSPSGSIHLPDQAIRLYDELEKLEVDALQMKTVEDNSKGYALSSYEPLRKKQLGLREYALKHERLLHRVALNSGNSHQRAIAADMLGYARRSKAQITTLFSASRDPNEGVRNNALRALGVLAQAGGVIAKNIPADPFIALLNSGTWTDRNKGSRLIVLLSKTRDPQLLRQLRRRALASLIEMSRWRDPLHAGDVRMILGRVAGIPEEQLAKLVAAGDVEQIVTAAQLAR